MKRKPDAMIAVIALFFIGLVVSGFSSALTNSDENVDQTNHRAPIQTVSRY